MAFPCGKTSLNTNFVAVVNNINLYSIGRTRRLVQKYGGTTHIAMKEKKDKDWLVTYYCSENYTEKSCVFWINHLHIQQC